MCVVARCGCVLGACAVRACGRARGMWGRVWAGEWGPRFPWHPFRRYVNTRPYFSHVLAAFCVRPVRTTAFPITLRMCVAKTRPTSTVVALLPPVVHWHPVHFPPKWFPCSAFRGVGQPTVPDVLFKLLFWEASTQTSVACPLVYSVNSRYPLFLFSSSSFSISFEQMFCSPPFGTCAKSKLGVL